MYHLDKKRFLTACLLLWAALGLTAQTTFTAHLSGRNEVLPVATGASGTVTATLDGDELTVEGQFSGLRGNFDATVAGGAHIHTGYAGQNGGIALGLTTIPDLDLKGGTFSSVSNTFTLTEEQKTALMNRQFYVNIHTTAYGSGEIRGQLLPEADQHYRVNLLGGNEVPAVMSTGRGGLTLEVSGDQLVVTGAFSQLEGDYTASHLHLAMAGSNGGVVFPLMPTLNADQRSGIYTAANNTFTLTEEQKTALEARQYYANVHSTNVGSGELRGQVTGMADLVFRAHLSGANEVPSLVSGGAGVIQAELFGDSLVVSGTFSGLEAAVATNIAGGAHIHTGYAGQNGGVAFPLTATLSSDMLSGTFAAANNQFTLTAEQKQALLARGMYCNIHSTARTSGEIRGQLLPESQYAFTGELSSIFQLPAVVSRAFGGVKAELNGNQLTVSGTFSNLSSALNVAIAGGAHLHIGMAGQNGGVEFPLVVNANADLLGGVFPAEMNRFTLSGEQVAAVKARGYYVNVHTISNGGGEIRTQLLPEANYYFAAPLSGASSAPAFNTPGAGMFIIEVAGQKAVATGSFANLAGDFAASVAGGAHLHSAPAGSTGGITQPLNVTVGGDSRSGILRATDNRFDLSPENMMLLRSRGLYANIHSQARTAGEIRGQCLPFATAYLTATLRGVNRPAPVATTGAGAMKLELHGAVLTATGSFRDLSGDFAANIAGGSHLHIGGPGVNGGIAISLNADVEGDLKSGAYRAENNTFPLDQNQIEALLAGDYYVNIHTSAHPGGEIRGQVLPEINLFPTNAPAVILPVDGAALTLAGLSSTPFLVQWTPADDANDLVYLWQLSATPDFSAVVFQQNVGADLEFVSDFGTVNDLLIGAGLPIGGTATLYHRVIASDGSVFTAGAGASVQITRGIVESTQFVAQLSGHNEVLPIATMATGRVEAELQGDDLILSGSFRGLSTPVATNIAGGAHIHLGYAGQNGGVQFPLSLDLDEDLLGGSLNPANNTFTLSEEQKAALQARRLYVNIHTEAYTGGELRGQLLPASDEVYTASLLGSNEVPAILTRGAGALQLELNGSELTVSGSFAGLTGDFAANIAGGAHLHAAVAGRNGGISVPLNATVAADNKSGVFAAVDNTFILTAEQVALLRARSLYANIHTTAYNSGELRGQVVGAAQAVFRAHLSGTNAVPVKTSRANGVVMAEFMQDSVLILSGSFGGLGSALATNIAGGIHLHSGLAGQAGPVEIVVNSTLSEGDRMGTFEAENNRFVLTPEQKAALFARGLYMNIHSMENTSGEIRGQLLAESQAVFTGFMSGIFTMPSVSTLASGAVKAELNGNRLTLSGAYANLSSELATNIAGGVHIHEGMAGSTGGIEFVLNTVPAEDLRAGIFPATGNRVTLSSGQVDTLFERGYYVNLHTTHNPSGELRAQLLPEATAYFAAPLSGTSQTPAVRTPGRGMAILELSHGAATLTGSFSNLESALATDVAGGVHIHAGLAGQNGPVINIINSTLGDSDTQGTFMAMDNRFPVSDGWVDTLVQRAHYVNLHTLDNMGGAIRGQLLPMATAYFTSTLAGRNATTPVVTTGRGALKLEYTAGELTLSGAFAGLTGAFDEMVAGGSHLHLGFAGNNGGIGLSLTPVLAEDKLSGVYVAGSNLFDLSGEQVASLFAGEFYANIHTEAVGSGEIRGQILPEINMFPGGDAAITAPADGAMVTLEGSGSTSFRAEWSAASDRDSLAYIWQLAADDNFETILFAQAVSNDLFFETDFQTVDALLQSAGVEVGNSITLYHRAVASDGSVATPGAGASVTLTRGTVTGLEDLLRAQLSVKLYPTIARERVTMEMSFEESDRAIMRVTNTLGQVLETEVIQLIPGTINQQIEVNNYQEGTYFVQLYIRNHLVSTQRFIVQ